MKSISTNCKNNFSNILSETNEKWNIVIREDIKDFLRKNSGGYPIKNYVVFNGEDYEVRVFLSLDSSDNNYYIEKPLNFFQERTRGKIIPIGLDSGDNYYCVNNETGKVYYWSSEDDKYYLLSESLTEFIKAFE